MSRQFARSVIRFRFAVVAFWLAAAVAATMLLPSIDEGKSGALGELVPANAEAIDTELRAFEQFEFPLLSRTIIVQRDPQGLSLASQVRVVRRVIALNRQELPALATIAGALAVTNLLGQPPFSRERSTTALTYLFLPPATGREAHDALAERVIRRLAYRPSDATVGVTGAIPARAQRVQVIDDSLAWLHIATLALVTLIVAAHFRSVLAPLLNLAAVAVAFLVSVRVAAGAGQELGVNVPREVTPVIVALLFGVITDYAIFFLSPFRRRLTETRDVRRATEDVIAQQFPIVLTAGLTVAAASASLAAAQLRFLQAFGPGIAIAVLIGMLVALTFVPALVAIGGSRLFWPTWPGRALERQSFEEQERRGTRRQTATRRVLALTSRRPLPVAVVVVALLLAAASGLRSMEVGDPLIRGLPAEAEANRAYVEASRGFAPGILSPTLIVVEGPGITDRRPALSQLQSLIERHPGVAQVVGPREQPSPLSFGAVYSRTGDAVRYLVVLVADPLGSRALDVLRRLRARMPALLTQVGLADAGVGFAGDTAIVEETVTKTQDDIVRIGPAAMLAVFVVLAIFLRALVAPLYLIAASTFALAASLGLTVYVFQNLIGWPELTFYVPFAAGVLLLALGSDYNVYIAGRIWQEAGTRPLREAVEVAGERAASAITAAGLILAGSFGIIALIPLRAFRELAFAMSAGLLIDAFLVRTLLVPALIVLVGERGGWPGGGLKRRLPERLRRQQERPVPAPPPATAAPAAPDPPASGGARRRAVATGLLAALGGLVLARAVSRLVRRLGREAR